MTSYDAWLVDLDGTLYWSLGVKAAMAVELVALGGGAVSVLRAFRREHERLREEEFCSENKMPFDEQVRRTAHACGVSEEQVRTTVARWMVERPGRWIRVFRRRELLCEIAEHRSRGGKTGLVSDYPAKRKLLALGAIELFDVVVANGEPGGPPALKPSPKGYLLAAARLGVEPRRCLVLGDRRDADGRAAKRGGMGFRQVG